MSMKNEIRVNRFCDKIGISTRVLFIIAYEDADIGIIAYNRWMRTGEDDKHVLAYMERYQE